MPSSRALLTWGSLSYLLRNVPSSERSGNRAKWRSVFGNPPTLRIRRSLLLYGVHMYNTAKWRATRYTSAHQPCHKRLRDPKRHLQSVLVGRHFSAYLDCRVCSITQPRNLNMRLFLLQLKGFQAGEWIFISISVKADQQPPMWTYNPLSPGNIPSLYMSWALTVASERPTLPKLILTSGHKSRCSQGLAQSISCKDLPQNSYTALGRTSRAVPPRGCE